MEFNTVSAENLKKGMIKASAYLEQTVIGFEPAQHEVAKANEQHVNHGGAAHSNGDKRVVGKFTAKALGMEPPPEQQK